MLKVTEMSLDASLRFAGGEVLLSDNPVSDFFNWLFENNSFACVVVVSQQGFFRNLICGGKRLAWPRTIISLTEIKSHRLALEKAARKGHGLVIGVRANSEDIEKFFCKLGYRVDGHGVYGGGDEHDPSLAGWCRQEFTQAVDVASKLCQFPLCVFAHDADPVYLIEGRKGDVTL